MLFSAYRHNFSPEIYIIGYFLPLNNGNKYSVYLCNLNLLGLTQLKYKIKQYRRCDWFSVLDS